MHKASTAVGTELRIFEHHKLHEKNCDAERFSTPDPVANLGHSHCFSGIFKFCCQTEKRKFKLNLAVHSNWLLRLPFW